MTSFVSLWIYSPWVVDLMVQVINVCVLTFLNSIPNLRLLRVSAYKEY